MQRVLANHTLCATLFILFALALAMNGLLGGSWLAAIDSFTAPPRAGDLSAAASPTIDVAGTPTLPPDPWEQEPGSRKLLAGTPTLPPDPWEQEPGSHKLLAGTPTLPPDPWEQEPGSHKLLAGTPTLPPDPWEQEPGSHKLLAGTPTLPPDPWEQEPGVRLHLS